MSRLFFFFFGGGVAGARIDFPELERDRSPKRMSEQTTTTWRTGTPLRPSGKCSADWN